MPEPPLIASETISFEEAIAFTQSLLSLDQNAVSETDLEQAIASLVKTENGARGFFVTYLTDERPLADQPTVAVLQALQSSSDIVAELLVKNLAMSSAMAIAHRRRQNEDMAQGSDRVRSRSIRLIQQLQLPGLAAKAQALQASAQTGEGAYAAFLDRWGYDAEQRRVIQDAVGQAIEPAE